MTKGSIGVTTENIFPVIKKFLYSDHEIFLRELVSNAIDATGKLKTLASFGEFKGDTSSLKVKVSVDKENGTLTVSDEGIGMDADDIQKYINQIAFSGAEEFLAKYKDSANSIIGHFGLGFYSAFMVSKKVVIRSLSYKENSKAVEWSCDGSPEYEMKEIEKDSRGTDVILYIDDESKEFLEIPRITTLLKKYCRFLPVPVIFGKKQDWKDGKLEDTDEDNVINSTEPLWTSKPTDLKDEDYLKFYRELMPGNPDPLFWIHLNVDYPFTLTGILYFPKINNNIDIQRNRIELYCNQVYVTDQVEGVVPEFMTLLQGVLDSPDIPLNVSRSYLQADSQVKKISTYISKKVAERLDKLMKDNREEFISKWDDLKVFIDYGMLTDQKFCESAMKFYMLKDSEGKYFTLEEYRTLIAPEQTDKDENVIYLYTTDPEVQYSYIKSATDKGYSVLVLSGQLDTHIVGLLESKLEKTRFVRIDSDVIDRLIVKTDKSDSGLTPIQTDMLTSIFRSRIPSVEKAEFAVGFESQGADAAPAVVVQEEFMRRMKEMAATQPGMSFYSQLPDQYRIVVNTDHPAVVKIKDLAVSSLQDRIAPLRSGIEILDKEISDARKKAEENKEGTPDLTDKEKQLKDLHKEENDLLAKYASEQPAVLQIIDLALLRAGLLSGSALDEFIRRTASLL